MTGLESKKVAASEDEFIPFARPDVGEEEIEAVSQCLRSGWLTTGKVTKRFEAAFADYVGASHALAVNSATAGLHLALEALGVGRGDKVITTPYTFTASAEVIRYLGADPVFVDIDERSFCIDPAEVERTLDADPAIKGILAVHIAGQVCDMTALTKIARDRDVFVVEDAAHALPATHRGKKVGSLSDATVFSFYATKTITTGEGGMVTTEHPDIADRIRIMRLHGISHDVFDRYTSNKPSWYYEVVAPGYKYNMPDIAAAIGVEQLKKAQRLWMLRTRIAKHYNKAFDELAVVCPVPILSEDVHSWHLYILRLNLELLTIDRDCFIEKMFEYGVGTSVHFIPLHIQPYWRDRYGFEQESFPVSYRVYGSAVSLPIYPGMTDSEIDRVVTAVSDIVRSHTR